MARGRDRGESHRVRSTAPGRPPCERLRAGGVELAVHRLEAETDRRPRLVLLHGGPGLDHHLLLPLGTLLAESYQVWMPDLPGHGGSDLPSGRAPGLAILEDRLAAWLGGLPGGYDAVVGHSMGAWITSRLLRQGRIAPRAVALLAPPAAGQERGATALRRAAAAMVSGGRGGRASRAVRSALSVRSGRPARSARSERVQARVRERARRELRAHVAAETAGAARPEFLDALERVEARDTRGYGVLLRDFHRALTGPVRPFDPGCPVLVVCGARDLTTPPDQARRVAESLAGARLELIDDAGHYPFAERPEAVANLLLGFLGGVL